MTNVEQGTSELAELYGALSEKGTIQLQPFFFAIYTYYALLMKLLAVELASLQNGAMVSSMINTIPVLSDKELIIELTDLENGGAFARLGINNFLEGDFFGWYLDIWKLVRDLDFGKHIRSMAQSLSNFEPATSTLEPDYTRDLLKKLYQYLLIFRYPFLGV